jgi:hypothetical protein
LKERPDVGHESLCSQMEKLLVGPLKATAIPTLIIIDALDECKDKEPASAILSILSRYVDQIPNVKFFITGRPEPRIRSGFRLESLAPITEVLKLHEVKPEVVDRDIELLFRTQLASLAKNRSDLDLTEDWPSSSDIKILCKKAAGFFIYASTVVKFVASESDPPTERLSLITSLPQSTIEEGKSGVDQLYTKVLQQAFSDVHAETASDASVSGLWWGQSCSSSTPFQSRVFQSFWDSIHNISTAPFAPSILSSWSQRAQKTPFEFSTNHFLTSSWTQIVVRIKVFVEPAGHHAEILLACLRLMGKRLKRNICNLDDYAVLSEVKDLSSHRRSTLEMLWNMHASSGPSTSWRSLAAAPMLRKCRKQLTSSSQCICWHWIEVLVLTGNLGVGVHAMNDIEQWYNLVSDVQVACQNLYS